MNDQTHAIQYQQIATLLKLNSEFLFWKSFPRFHGPESASMGPRLPRYRWIWTSLGSRPTWSRWPPWANLKWLLVYYFWEVEMIDYLLVHSMTMDQKWESKINCKEIWSHGWKYFPSDYPVIILHNVFPWEYDGYRSAWTINHELVLLVDSALHFSSNKTVRLQGILTMFEANMAPNRMESMYSVGGTSITLPETSWN